MKNMTQKSGIVIFLPVVTIAVCNCMECFKWFGKIKLVVRVSQDMLAIGKMDAGSLGFHGEGKHCKL